MHWLDGVPGVFDFDDCAHYWFVADVAYALRDVYDDRIERIDLADPLFRAFVAGYRSTRPLSDDHLHLLPVFVRAHNVYWSARLHRSVADGAIPGESQWTTDLRRRLVTVVDRFRDGFEEHPLAAYLA